MQRVDGATFGEAVEALLPPLRESAVLARFRGQEVGEKHPARTRMGWVVGLIRSAGKALLGERAPRYGAALLAVGERHG